MIADVLSGLLQANLALGVAVLAVIAARKPVRRMFGARAAYGLWLIAPLAAAAVLLPRPAAPTMLSPVAITVSAVVAEAAPQGFDWRALQTPGLFGLWIAGALAVAALLATRQAQFLAEARAGRAGPAVVGAIRPRIVLPSDFEARFAPAERAVILAHEAAHLAGGDAGVNALAAALQCLCWFNPLAHLGAQLMRIDQELACDAVVLGRHPQARKLYAAALLKTQLAPQALPLGCHWPPAGAHPLKERILMLKSPLPARSRRIAGLAVVALLSGAGAVTAWAAQPGGGLDPNQIVAGPGQQVLCKPDANHELHNCQVSESPWAKLATAADVAREYPAAAKAKGLTADVFLQCGVDGTRLSGCRAKKIYADQPQSAAMDAAFEAAAVKVAAIYRTKAPGKIPDPSFMTVQFRANPAMPGGASIGVAPTHAPPDLPIPAAASIVTEPVWLEKPSPQDFADAFAKIDQARGHVMVLGTMMCRVDGEGRLKACAVERIDITADEMTVDDGKSAGAWDAAMLSLSARFRMAPVSRSGVKTAGQTVRIPVIWKPAKA